MLYDTMLTSTQAFINVSEYNNIYDSPNRKTPAVNSSFAAENARNLSPNENHILYRESQMQNKII
jgi:hypothetical protein